MKNDSVILCGSNAYDKKYYFNPAFSALPQSVQDELHILCVLFTEEVGGIFTIGFTEEGGVDLRTQAAPEDYLYDEVGSGLLVSEVMRKRKDLFQSLSLYYRALILHEDMADLLDEESGTPLMTEDTEITYTAERTPEDED